MLSGGCLCGRVRYETDAAAFHETLCHCACCRRAFGATPVSWFSVPRTSLGFARERPTEYVSSPGVRRGFCAACGTSLTYASDALPDEIDVALATLDEPEALAPKDNTQAAERLSWTAIDARLPAYPRARGDGN